MLKDTTWEMGRDLVIGVRTTGCYLLLFIKDFDGKYEDKNLDKTSL